MIDLDVGLTSIRVGAGSAGQPEVCIVVPAIDPLIDSSVEAVAAVETIGMPECALNLAHGVAYLANAAKDRSATGAIGAAMEDAKKFGNLPVPMQIRNAPTKLMKGLGYGKGYEMYPEEDDLLPEKLRGKKYLKDQEN